MAAKNYNSLRMKDLESKFNAPPEIDQLLPVYLGLLGELGPDDSLKAVLSFAHTLGFQPKDKDALKNAKLVGKEIKKSIKRDKDNYYNLNLNVKKDPASAWKKMNERLGNVKNSAPSEIKIEDNDGKI